MTRMSTVSSSDDTTIAYWTSGQGPPLVVVHGTTADHTRWGPLLPHLEPHVTVHAIDRRGRGASGDGATYRARREFEDVAVVVEEVADRHGETVDVYGHSYGAFCTLGAATLTGAMRRLVLYEPPLGPTAAVLTADTRDRLAQLLRDGDRAGVVETFFRVVVGMPAEEITALQRQPSWPARVRAAHTILREEDPSVFDDLDPDDLRSVRSPTLLLTGSDSPAFLRSSIAIAADRLPDARVVVLERQQHVADVLAPAVFADHVLGFLAVG